MNMKQIILAVAVLAALGGEVIASQSTAQQRRIAAKKRRAKGQNQRAGTRKGRRPTTVRRGRGPQKPTQRGSQRPMAPISPRKSEPLEIVPIELTQSEQQQLAEADLVNYQELTARQAELINAGLKTDELTIVQDSLKELKAAAAEKLTLSKEQAEPVLTEEETLRKELEAEQEAAFKGLEEEFKKGGDAAKIAQEERERTETPQGKFEAARDALYAQLDEIKVGYDEIKQKYVDAAESYFKTLNQVMDEVSKDTTSPVSAKLQRIRDVNQNLAAIDKEFAEYQKANSEKIQKLREGRENIVQMASGGASDKDKIRIEIDNRFFGLEKFAQSINTNLGAFFEKANEFAVMIYDTDSDLHKMIAEMKALQAKINALPSGTNVDSASDPKREDVRNLVDVLRGLIMKKIGDQLRYFTANDLYASAAADSSVRAVINFFGNDFYNDTLVKPLNALMDSVRDKGNPIGFFKETKQSPRPKLFPDFK